MKMFFTSSIVGLISQLLLVIFFQELRANKQRESHVELASVATISPNICIELWLKTIVREIVQGTEPSCASIWHLSNSSKNLMNIVVQEFSKYIPIHQLDAYKNLSSILIPDSIVHPQSAINVLVLSQENQAKMRRTINMVMNNRIPKYAAVESRLPKTLIIIFGISRHFTLGKMISKILKKKWELNFFDLSIIYIHKRCKFRPQIFYYEGFAQKIISTDFSESVLVFPNKLRDMNGSDFIMANRKPSIYHYRTIEGNEDLDFHHPRFRINRTSGTFMYLKHYFCKIRHCRPIYKISNESQHVYYYHSLFDKSSFPNDSFGLCSQLFFIAAVIPHLKAVEGEPQFNYWNLINFLSFLMIFFTFVKKLIKHSGLKIEFVFSENTILRSRMVYLCWN